MAKDIPVRFINATSKSDFEVVVFTKNFSAKTVYYSVLEVLKTQGSAQFVFPASVSIGATYQNGGQSVTVGPFPAQVGSTWQITQDTPSSTAVLEQIQGAPPNPNNAIVVKNKKPNSWSGRMFDVGFYNNNRLLVTQPSVHVGEQVDFMLHPKIYFKVVLNMRVGDTLTSLEINTGLTEFDLSGYPNGIIVTLNQQPHDGEFIFTESPM